MPRNRRGGVAKKKKGGGVMSSLRGGFKSAVHGATGTGDEDEPKKQPSKFSKLFWNVVTGALVILAAGIWAKRCGILKW